MKQNIMAVMRFTPSIGRFKVSFVGKPSGLYSASVHVIIYAIFHYIGPRYNGARTVCANVWV